MHSFNISLLMGSDPQGVIPCGRVKLRRDFGECAFLCGIILRVYLRLWNNNNNTGSNNRGVISYRGIAYDWDFWDILYLFLASSGHAQCIIINFLSGSSIGEKECHTTGTLGRENDFWDSPDILLGSPWVGEYRRISYDFWDPPGPSDKLLATAQYKICTDS